MKHREEVVPFLQALQNTIIETFETLEPYQKFKKSDWNHHSGGGGTMAVLRGDVFEKAAVNWSGVAGDTFPGSDGEGPFFATGVSLITHMENPHAPTVHMNVRYIETADGWWFGGGYDLTPMGFPYAEDTQHFHATAREALAPYGAEIYEQFSQQAREYFFLPHRNKERGVGGLFFDHYTGNFNDCRAVWEAVAHSFLGAVMPIYERRIAIPYSEEDKALQSQMRAHYVEFNLIYDRGTRFGFLSGGNPEAILCSMPPHATW